MRTISSTPAEDALLYLWVWLSIHRRIRAALAVVFTCLVCQLINTPPALAAEDDSASQTSIDTYWLPLAGVTDTHGVPVGTYTELPLDYGQTIYVTRQIRGILMRLAWMIYTLVVYSILALCDFILSLEWVDWILSPFVLLSNTVQGLLTQTGIVGLGIFIAAVVIAWGLIRGKMGAAIAEIALVALFAGLVSTPIANPSEHIKSWISTSAEYGTEAGTATVEGSEEGAPVSTSPVSGPIIDLTVRNPALVLSFGSTLEGDECARIWDDQATSGADTEKLRKAVVGCNDELKAANETDNFVVFAFLLIFWISTGGLMALIVVFLAFLLKDVVLAGLGLINTVFRAHLAVFPGGGRQAFINAALQLLVNVFMVGAYIFLISLYLWLVGKFTESFGGTAMMIGNLIFGFVLIAMALTFWNLKRQGKSVAERIARALGSSPLNHAAPLQPSGFSRSATQLASSGRKTAVQQIRRRYMGKGLQTVAASAAAPATGGASVVAARAAAAGWFVAGSLYNAHTNGALQPGSGASPRTHTAPVRSPRELEAGPAGHGQSVRDENGAIPLGHRAPQDAASSSQPAEQDHSVAQARSLRTPELVEPAAGDRVPVTARARPADGSGATADTFSSEAAQHPATESTRKRSTMPAGQYGSVRVNRNGTTNNVLSGQLVSSVPEGTKVVRVWDIDESTPAQNRRRRQAATSSAMYQAQARSRANRAAERGAVR
ncbi:hypothetical protein ACH9DO_06910 [Kocuria sp. M1N1S27]|uniref:hypothetical protein n=1 Tax=Kocuria kalidii TaxID=3376283 RepID=UPI00378794EF